MDADAEQDFGAAEKERQDGRTQTHNADFDHK